MKKRRKLEEEWMMLSPHHASTDPSQRIAHHLADITIVIAIVIIEAETTMTQSSSSNPLPLKETAVTVTTKTEITAIEETEGTGIDLT